VTACRRERPAASAVCSVEPSSARYGVFEQNRIMLVGPLKLGRQRRCLPEQRPRRNRQPTQSVAGSDAPRPGVARATPERRLTGSRAKGRNTRDDPTIGPLRRHAKHHKCGGCAEVGALKQPPAPGRIVTAKDVKEDCPKKAGADAGPAA
jgi:hypothetical protein